MKTQKVAERNSKVQIMVCGRGLFRKLQYFLIASSICVLKLKSRVAFGSLTRRHMFVCNALRSFLFQRN
jgi:hypothetical protein